MKKSVSSISLFAIMSILTVFAVAPHMTQDAFGFAAGDTIVTRVSSTSITVDSTDDTCVLATPDPTDWVLSGGGAVAVTASVLTDAANCVVTLTTADASDTSSTPLVTYNTEGGSVLTSTQVPGGVPDNTPMAATVDGAPPTFVSAATASSTSITVTYTEVVDTAGVVNGDYTFAGIASAPTTTGIAGSGTATLTLSLSAAVIFGDGPITLTYTQTGAALEDAALNDVATHAGSAVTNNVAAPAAAPVGTGGGSGCHDCTPPTLGVDKSGTRLVSNGFTYNGNSVDVERFFTPYPLITVNVGQANKAEFKIYENQGPDNIKHFEFAFGLAQDQVISKSNAVIELDIDYDGTETVTIQDPENVLDNVRVKTSTVACDGDERVTCLSVTIHHTLRAPLDFNIVATNVWDFKRNAWQNTYNHGIKVVGESLNPPKEYEGIDKRQIYHLTETSKTTAIDEFGNSWSLEYGLWAMDYIPTKKIVDEMAMNGYPREHAKFDMYKYGQYLVAEDRLYEMCLECFDESYTEINNIFAYEYPIPINALDDPEIQKNMIVESEKAQKVMNHILDPILHLKQKYF